ncbi:Fur family transcriptional regulator [Sphingomonas naphthae]|uniref:Fur family transcriptional regulator n=1 Tax=Sphingomonas naphthae TaxID=1813468 RepID=A0ABY7TQA4_9SPHN|nr:Fur family transcriptional regulator [Sphingomonas naphthae]WCT74034.1 Fur family transcriptional regulator [Sphingomonas naphthae]
MAHTHQHTILDGEPLAEAAQAALTRAGEQWTPMRATVFAALAALGRPASAYDIADEVSQRQGRRVPANSVYRILDLFVAANLVQRVESANAYIVNAHPACRHDCMFLICDGCGTVTHLDEDKVTGPLRTAAESVGFTPTRTVLEVHGRCAACAAN